MTTIHNLQSIQDLRETQALLHVLAPKVCTQLAALHTDEVTIEELDELEIADNSATAGASLTGEVRVEQLLIDDVTGDEFAVTFDRSFTIPVHTTSHGLAGLCYSTLRHALIATYIDETTRWADVIAYAANVHGVDAARLKLDTMRCAEIRIQTLHTGPMEAPIFESAQIQSA